MQNIQYEIQADGVAVIRFYRPGSSANIFDRQTLLELDGTLGEIERETGAQGMVFCSAKETIFIAGADLHALEELDDAGLDEFIELGQHVFGRVARLPFPTVAAIHGACVGGGFELCLACDYRVATEDRSTRIGLPEVSLGILPAWGGSTRLPRLVGLPGALDVILAGKVLPARQALRRGLVDTIAPREYLMQAALRRIKKGKRRSGLPFAQLLLSKAPGKLLVGRRAHAKVMERTRGRYPAPLKALEVVMASTGSTEAASLARERKAVAELARTETCQNLMRLFQLQERAKKLRAPGSAPEAQGKSSPPPKRVCVIGAGVMGAGIAQWISARGFQIVLRDIDPDRVAAGMARIDGLYRAGMRRHIFSRKEARDGMDRIRPVAGETPLAGVDLVIEAAVEKLDLKKKIFSGLGKAARPDAILATNTSALPLSEIAAVTEHPERVMGLHFFNPVHRMQLVEVVAAQQTAPATIDAGLRFVQKIGKLPVLVRDSPGFLVNRILLPYMMHAVLLFDAGESLIVIDQSMLDFGMPMGPLRLIDEVGVDIAADVAKTLASAFSGRMAASTLLDRMLDAGMTGRKGGNGFYVLGKKGKASPNPEADRLRQAHEAKLSPGTIQRQLVLSMVNEAARCMEERVVEDARDVDLAMVMGAGFAPFRGGPLAYADRCGIGKIVAELSEFEKEPEPWGGPRFKPCKLLDEMAVKEMKFHENRKRTAA